MFQIINGERWEIIYHWVWNWPGSSTSLGIMVPIMLRKIEDR